MSWLMFERSGIVRHNNKADTTVIRRRLQRLSATVDVGINSSSWYGE